MNNPRPGERQASGHPKAATPAYAQGSGAEPLVPTSSRVLARVMDDLVTIPGTNIGLGLDALIGLVPGVGDAVGTTLSGAILIDAVRCRVPMSVLLRMAWNLLLDTGLGFIPGVGDVADAAHRANRKNLRLLEKAVASGHRVDTNTTGYLIKAISVVVIILAIMIAAAVLVIYGLLKLLGLT